MRTSILLTFIILLFSSILWAGEDCSSVDLNAGSNSPFKKIPIYDQDGVGLCYAYAAAQMVDYYRIKNGDTSYGLTNPLYTSWATYYKSRSLIKFDSLDNGGYSDTAVDALREVGTCGQEDVEKRLASLKNEANLTDAEFLFFLETMYKHFNGLFSSGSWNLALRDLKDGTSLVCKTKAKNLKSELDKSKLFAVAPTLVLENLFKGCKSKKVNVPALDNFSFGSDDKMKVALNGSLKKGLPAQIGICAEFFNNPNYRGLRGFSPPLLRSSNGNAKRDCGAHAVVVSAQAKIAGECHYQLRNSWGAQWYPYGATSCACITRNGKYKAQCARGEGREYVGCWFKQKTVLPNTGDVNVFK